MTSDTHRAIADIAYYLEQRCEEDSFNFMDGGLTLDVKSLTLAECRQNHCWEQLERNYFTVGGCISCPDEDFWEAL